MIDTLELQVEPRVVITRDPTDEFMLEVDEAIFREATHRDSSDMSFVEQEVSSAEEKKYLTATEFNYTMDLFNKKINSLYKLCRTIGEQQQEINRSLTKLVALDELNDEFWNVRLIIILFEFLIFIDIFFYSVRIGM